MLALQVAEPGLISGIPLGSPELCQREILARGDPWVQSQESVLSTNGCDLTPPK